MNITTSYYFKFKEALLPYISLWEDWIISDFCFLNEKEIMVVNVYRKEKSVMSVAKAIRRSANTANVFIRRVTSKLIFGKKIFESWKIHQSIDKEYPLNIPIPCLKAPVRLKRQLIFLGDTLNEVLRENSISDLRKFVGWGNGTIEQLRTFLDTYGYAELLRENVEKKQSNILFKQSAIIQVENFDKGVWPKVKSVGDMLPSCQLAGEDTLKSSPASSLSYVRKFQKKNKFPPSEKAGKRIKTPLSSPN